MSDQLTGQQRVVDTHADLQEEDCTDSLKLKREAEVPVAAKRDRWYRDPSKIVGVLGFMLALGTLGERIWVREQEQNNQRLQQLREVTSALADIQVEFLEILSKAPPNTYALGVAKNTKRQMYMQSAAALLNYRAVRKNASAQVFAALGAEMSNDGRYEAARTFYTDALAAPGIDDAARPYVLRSLGQLYRIPNTKFANLDLAREYFRKALAELDKRSDDSGQLAWAETILSEASLEVVYGDLPRTKALASQARERIGKVRSLSPFRTQLERLAAAYERGEQYPQTQDAALQQVSTVQQGPTIRPASVPQSTSVGATLNSSPSHSTIEIWLPLAGQVSGVEMEVSIDGKEVGHVSNLQDTRQLDLPELLKGVHRFTFTNMKAYFIDATKAPSMTGQGFSCTGLFELTASKAILKANVGSGPNGVMCTLQ
jgi:tetratricopeptide (TPR) repeat protein